MWSEPADDRLTTLPLWRSAESLGGFSNASKRGKKNGFEGKGLLSGAVIQPLELLPDSPLGGTHPTRCNPACARSSRRAPVLGNAVFLRQSVLFQRNHPKSDRNTTRSIYEYEWGVKTNKSYLRCDLYRRRVCDRRTLPNPRFWIGRTSVNRGGVQLGSFFAVFRLPRDPRDRLLARSLSLISRQHLQALRTRLRMR
jgi:hypothetical protein